MKFCLSQRYILGLCLIMAMPSLVEAYCYERFYTPEHLQKHPQQVVKSIVFDLQDIYNSDSTDDAKIKLQIRMQLRADETLVATANADCNYTPNTNRTQGFCQIKAPGQGSFTFKGNGSWMYDSRSILVNLSADSIFENSTYSKASNYSASPTLAIPRYDHSMRVDRNEMVSSIKGECEPVMFKAGTVNPSRLWNEAILYSIRNDLARPTVTARNLYHLSALMWDVYTSFDNRPNPLFLSAIPPISRNLTQARDVAQAYAAVTFLKERFKNAPVNTGDQYPVGDGDSGDGVPDMFLDQTYKRILNLLDFDLKIYQAYADYGKNFADQYLALHLQDGSREADNYRPAPGYVLKNNMIADISQSGLRAPSTFSADTLLSDYYNFLATISGDFDYMKAPLLFDTANYRGTEISSNADINYWLRLNIPGAIDQGGTATASEQSPLTLFWGNVKTFSDLSAYKSSNKPGVYFDPENKLPLFETSQDDFIKANLQVIEYSALLNPLDTSNYDFDQDVVLDQNPGAELMDISPLSLGNNSLGTNDGKGYSVNPITGQSYQPNLVKKADYYRSIAEFWADGPESETPPGHWNTMANYVLDEMKKKSVPHRWLGQGQDLEDQEYTLKLYLTLNGALHDAAIAAWGLKGYYQGNRPVTVIRQLAAMAESDPAFATKLVSMSPNLKMVRYTKTITSPQGQRLRQIVTKLAVKAWRGAGPGMFYQSEGPGPELRDLSFRFRNQVAEDENTFYANASVAGVGWILAENWMPYQRQTFVTPPFPGFVSGHSTFSRAAAEVLAAVTGSPFFPDGIGRYEAPDLHFEYDDNAPFEFQWATYFDAADVSGLSRIYGGIHASYDDIPAREIGSKVGQEAVKTADQFFQ